MRHLLFTLFLTSCMTPVDNCKLRLFKVSTDYCVDACLRTHVAQDLPDDLLENIFDEAEEYCIEFYKNRKCCVRSYCGDEVVTAAKLHSDDYGECDSRLK